MNRKTSRGRRDDGRVLWGRVGAFALAVALAFLFGRLSAPDGAPPEELAAARSRIAELEQENLNLAEAQKALAAGGIDARPAAADDGPGGPPAAADGDGEVYTVQEGDTLESIAAEQYGDGSRFPLLAEANDVDATNLVPGQQLRIPPDPEAAGDADDG